MKQLLLSMAFLSLTSLGFAQKKTNYSTMPSQVKEAKEKGDYKLANSIAQDYINNYLFKLKDDKLFNKENLGFIGEFLDTESSKGFRLFMKEPEKINRILGEYMAEGYLLTFIDKKYMPQGDYNKIEKPDWNALETVVTAKFGTLGQETVYGRRLVYCWVNEDWGNYGFWYQKYFEMALKHSRLHINNFSWNLFEHVDEPKILAFACEVMKYSIEELSYNDYQALDTYANLLYKTGNKEEAIKWEEKAIKLSDQDKGLMETLEKMKKGEKTWPN